MTSKECQDYIRKKIGILDNNILSPLQILKEVNFSQTKVHNDIINLGFEGLTKSIFNSGYIFSAPSDIMSIPNASRYVLASNGTRRVMAIVADANGWDASSGTATFTFREPGTAYQAYTITFSKVASTGQNPVVTLLNTAITITYESGVTLPSSVVTAVSNNVIVNDLLSSAVGAVATALVEGSPTPSIAVETIAGFKTGWRPARKVEIEEFVTEFANTYSGGTTLNPIYTIEGNTSSTKIFKFYPTGILQSKLEYFFSVPDLVEDTDTLGLPKEYQELVLIDAIAGCYETLKLVDISNNMKIDYQSKIKEYEANYQNLLGGIMQERERISTNKR